MRQADELLKTLSDSIIQYSVIMRASTVFALVGVFLGSAVADTCQARVDLGCGGILSCTKGYCVAECRDIWQQLRWWLSKC